MTNSLRIDNQMMGLALFTASDNIIDYLLLIIMVSLRQKNVLRTVCDTAPQSDIPRMTSHNLDDTATLMGGRGDFYLVNCLHGRIDRRIKTYGIFRTGNVQIYGSGNSHRIDTQS